MKKKEIPIRAWHIGEHGEVYAGRCGEVAIKRWYRKLVGNRDEADECIASCFEEIPASEMKRVQNWDSDGRKHRSSFLKEAELCVELPMQISTTYV
jgi:hypothetical protein